MSGNQTRETGKSSSSENKEPDENIKMRVGLIAPMNGHPSLAPPTSPAGSRGTVRASVLLCLALLPPWASEVGTFLGRAQNPLPWAARSDVRPRTCLRLSVLLTVGWHSILCHQGALLLSVAGRGSRGPRSPGEGRAVQRPCRGTLKFFNKCT